MQINWRQLYFVLATLLGLVLLVIGATTLLNTTLTSTVFKTQRWPEQPPIPTMAERDALRLQDTSTLSESDRLALEQWRRDYEAWQKQQASYDPELQQRQRSLANGITMLVVGLPVFALHAPKVFREKSAHK